VTAWWLGWAEHSSPVHVRLAEVSGIVVAGLAGSGKTILGLPRLCDAAADRVHR
jgi:hypothetical protein